MCYQKKKDMKLGDEQVGRIWGDWRMDVGAEMREDTTYFIMYLKF